MKNIKYNKLRNKAVQPTGYWDLTDVPKTIKLRGPPKAYDTKLSSKDYKWLE